MSKQETNISELYNLYQFEWAIKDFLVTDECYPIIEENVYSRIDGYIIGICLQGRISHESNAQTYHGVKNSMLISKPLQPFKVIKISSDCRLRSIIFSKRFLVANNINEQVLNKFQFTHFDALPLIHIEEQEAKNMVQQFEAVWTRFQDINYPFRREVIGNLLLVLLHDFEAIYRKHFRLLETKSTRGKELAIQFTQLVQKHFRKEHSVEFYAKEMHVSPKHLTTTIKQLLPFMVQVAFYSAPVTNYNASLTFYDSSKANYDTTVAYYGAYVAFYIASLRIFNYQLFFLPRK
jgi:hypothetical protein